jgi:hypothetical protein
MNFQITTTVDKDDNSIQSSALTFTSKEFNEVIKLSKKVSGNF